ncbi:MAG: hypothetical protein VYC42_11610 [Pseudomonadota bacterium]|nr:hypothetical protein [Pseudomonadota bacterium]
MNRALACLALAACSLCMACAAPAPKPAPALEEAPPWEPTRDVPEQLLAAYPPGSQQRSLADVESVFALHKQAITREFERRLRRPASGILVLSLVLSNTGAVEFVQVTAATSDLLALSKPVEALVRSFDFGPAPGSGHFVFSYPIIFLPH